MAPNLENAAYAWSRYRRVMRWLMAAMVVLMLVVLRLAGHHAGSTSIRRYVLAALCIGVTMLVGSMLMAVVFIRRARSVAGESLRPGPPQSDAPE